MAAAGARFRLLAVPALVAAAASVVALTVPARAAPARHPAGHVAATPAPTVQHVRFHAGDSPERASLVRVDLSHHFRLGAVLGSGEVAGARETVGSMARRTKALAGINADFFDLYDDDAPPRGGVVDGGVVVKSPLPKFNANFYVTGDGRAHIGDPGFHATVTIRAGKTSARHRLFSVNNPVDARQGRITLLTSRLAHAGLNGCATDLIIGHGATAHIRAPRTAGPTFRAPRPGVRMLAGCGAGGQWLRTHAAAGAGVDIALGFEVGDVRTLVSGGRVLLRHGRPWHDRTGEVLAYDAGNPLTFACASPGGRHVVLGVVDGRSDDSYGLSYGQLRSFLRTRLHCSSAMVFDGGGSTTLVSRGRHGGPVEVRNVPAEWPGPRPVADGLFVYASR